MAEVNVELQEGDEEEFEEKPLEGSDEGDGEKTAEELAAEEQAKIDAKAAADAEAAKASKDEEISSLRSLAREQKRALEGLEAQLAKTNKVLEEANLITEEDKEKDAKISAAQQARQDYLETILDFMEMSPKYEDVTEVVSQQHFDEMVDAMTDGVVKEQGGNPKEIRMAIEAEIWAKRNPYKYMYGIIKEYHPAYKKTEASEKKEEKEVPKIPGSLQDLPGGGGNDKGPWTAAKIDALPEAELDKVPADIYQKWLRGQLK